MDKLKPCPFCGGKAEITETASGHGSREFTMEYRIGCQSCRVYFRRETRLRIEGGKPVFIVNGYQEAINDWNRRAGETE